MKVLITTCAVTLLFSIFTLFQYDNNQYIKWLERIKWEADNASDAVALYYDQDEFSKGIKVFSKSEGNKAAEFILMNNLDPDSDGVIHRKALREKYQYYIYYFDGNGKLTVYKENTRLREETFVFPYLFKEPLTGYERLICEAAVVVTVDAGRFDYRLSFINDPHLIRTSGYEYKPY